MKGDIDRKILVEKILQTIAHDTAAERIYCGVIFLMAIHQCQKKSQETTEAYANRFEASVARYVHQKNNHIAQEDQRWALLLLQNARLSPDTRNSIMFQLTSGAALRQNTEPHRG